MPRYGEGSVVGKAWEDSHPVASAVVPGAAVGLGAYKLKAGIRPNPSGAVAAGQKMVSNSAEEVERAARAKRAAQLKGKAPTGLHPLRLVGQKTKAWNAQHLATGQLKAAERGMTRSERTLAHIKTVAPKNMNPKLRAGRAGMGAALVGAGGYGLYRRFVAPKPGMAPPPGGPGA